MGFYSPTWGVLVMVVYSGLGCLRLCTCLACVPSMSISGFSSLVTRLYSSVISSSSLVMCSCSFHMSRMCGVYWYPGILLSVFRCSLLSFSMFCIMPLFWFGVLNGIVSCRCLSSSSVSLSSISLVFMVYGW